MADFTDQYNTKLSPSEEAAFQDWAEEQSKNSGRNRLNDLYDYDLRGFWKNDGQFSDNGHASDYYKKPNHPTFSDQSQYHGVDGHVGGSWSVDPVTGVSFTPGKSNLEHHGSAGLQQYFQQAEPGVTLAITPQGTGSMNPFKVDPLWNLFNGGGKK